MVHGDELRQIDVGGLPELLRQIEEETALRRREKGAADDQPLPRVRRRLVNAVVEETERARSEDVGHETPPLSIERVQEGTRSLELLDFLDGRAGPRGEVVLRDAVG